MTCFWLLLFLVIVAGKTCDITDYGAKGDNSTDNTKAVQAAIDDCLNGGTVSVPSGLFMTYPLQIINAVGLNLEIEGSLVAGSRDGWPVEGGNYIDFLTISGGSGVTIKGGMLNGMGTPWYIAFDEGKLKYGRPDFVVVTGTKDFKLLHTTILNAPQFNVYLAKTDGAEFGWVNITSQWYDGGKKEPHNTDGIDPGDNSNNIWIHDCHIDNGDDSVAVKPGSVKSGCTRDILVENSNFYHGHGCSIGSVGKGCVKNVIFRNITMTKQENGCRVKTYSDEAGFVTNITWQDIKIRETGSCISVNANYKPPPKNPKYWINVTDLHFINIDGECTSSDDAFEAVCPAASPCFGINLQNVNIRPFTHEMVCQHAHGTANNVNPKSCLKS